jgi:hypothetical protein
MTDVKMPKDAAIVETTSSGRLPVRMISAFVKASNQVRRHTIMAPKEYMDI